MIEQLTEINDRVNAAIEYQGEPAGEDHWQTPAESRELGTGDCEDIAIAKYIELRAAGIQAELCYCIWTNPAPQPVKLINGRERMVNKKTPHMVCMVGALVLDNIVTEVRAMDERPDLEPVYAISHRGLRNWGSYDWRPARQNRKFGDLIDRLARVAGPSGG